MNSKLVLVAALAAVTLTAASQAQTTAPQPAAAAAPTAPPPPQAIPAKIALIELQEVASSTNEGQNSLAALQKKLESTRQKLEGQKAEIDSLTKQLQAAPATSDEERASRTRSIEAKQKQLQLDGDEFNTTANAEAQEAINKVIVKLGPLVVKYVQQNGYTMLLDNSAAQQQQQTGGLNLLWGGTDISQAVVDAYNAAYPAAAPVPSAPSAARPRTPTAKPAPKQ